MGKTAKPPWGSGEIPPKLLRYEILVNDQAPALAKIQIQSGGGTAVFLVNKRILEDLGRSCLDVAAKLAKTSKLN